MAGVADGHDRRLRGPPVTTPGRLVSVALMVMGVVVFGAVTAPVGCPVYLDVSDDAGSIFLNQIFRPNANNIIEGIL